MRPWTRREVLAALGSAAAAPLLASCGAGSLRPERAAPVDRRSLASLRTQLRHTLSALEGHLDGAWAAVHIDRVDSASADASEIATGTAESLRVHLGGRARGQWREVAISSADPARIAAAAAQLTAGLSPREGRTGAGRQLVEIAAPAELEPGRVPRSQWADRVAALRDRAEATGGSRIVYRGAYLQVCDRRRIYLDAAREIDERQLCARAGVALVAWTGDTAAAATAERAGAIALDQALDIGAGELEAAADGALSLLSARGTIAGELDVILAPEVAALFAHRCVADLLCADRWLGGGVHAASLVGQRIADPRVSLTDDPGAAGAYGRYLHDDEGVAATATALVQGGVLAGPLTSRRSAAALGTAPTGHGRRAAPGEPARAQPAHVALAGGDGEPGALVSEIERGVLLEGALAAGVDPRDWSAIVRARVGHEIENGRITGRRFANVVVRGRVPALLTSVRGVGSDRRSFAAPDSGAPTSRSAPSLLLRATVAGGQP